jgi:hypothetical protein
MSMLPVSLVRPQLLTVPAAISASRMMVVSILQGLMVVQFCAMASLTMKPTEGGDPESRWAAKIHAVRVGKGEEGC